MGKFLSAVLFALTCAAYAGALPRQAGVRVGPEAEESKPNGGASHREEKKEEKPAANNAGRHAAKPANDKPASKPPTPSDATAAASTPVGSGATRAASDAPVKPGPGVGVPVNNPAKPASANTAPANTPAPASPNTPAPAPAAAAVPLTSVYRIGVGDILDIRLLNQPDARVSTLYTVLSSGVIEYPLIRDHVAVAGMTAEELSAQLVAELRHRGIFERPQVRVSVREYNSHAVLVSGLVSDPGTKIIRREAVPLYVVVAESQPKPEAGRAVVISHATGKTTSVDLLDAAGMATLVQAGDVVTLVVRPPEFFYVGGEIAAPGQKNFHAGMTLTQAVLASGGVTPQAGAKIKVLRQGADGRLVTTEYDLKQIEGGVVPDPQLQPGDRIEVSRAGSRK
jgi:protein involved in polysaccharide export with SLBB domain